MTDAGPPETNRPVPQGSRSPSEPRRHPRLGLPAPRAPAPGRGCWNGRSHPGGRPRASRRLCPPQPGPGWPPSAPSPPACAGPGWAAEGTRGAGLPWGRRGRGGPGQGSARRGGGRRRWGAGPGPGRGAGRRAARSLLGRPRRAGGRRGGCGFGGAGGRRVLPAGREGSPEPGIPPGWPRPFSGLPRGGHCHRDPVSAGLAVKGRDCPSRPKRRVGAARGPALRQHPLCSRGAAPFPLGHPGSPGETQLPRAAPSPASPRPRSAMASFKTGNGLRAEETCVWVGKVVGVPT